MPHRSPEKTVQIKNRYDYIITLIKRRKKTFLSYENLLVLHLKTLESLSSKDACGKIV